MASSSIGMIGGKAMAKRAAFILVASVGISVSAFSTFYYNANPSISISGNNNAAAHHNRRSHSQERRSGSAPGWMLHSLPEDGNNEGGEGGDGVIDGEERRRKRDILKRTLGLGSTSDGSGSGSGSGTNGPVKLNTDSLFQGMPSMDSILGAPSGSGIGGPLPNVVPENLPSTSSSGNSDVNQGSGGFQQQGQVKKEPDLLTPEDMADLDSKYDSIQYQSEQLVSDELSKGPDGKLAKTEDDITIKDETSTTSDGGALNITQEEAKQIVDYAIAEEKATEKRQLNKLKKKELIQSWENEGRAQEELIESNMASSTDGGDDILQKDGVAREIISNAQQREEKDSESRLEKQELDFYERQILQRREMDGSFEKATSEMEGADTDMDDVYEQALDSIRSSRKEKLGPKSLGVYANSIALEEGREYVRDQKAQKEFLKNVEMESGLTDATDEEVAQFFQSPVNYEEERMYRSIVRQIVNKRPEIADPAMDGTSSMEGIEKDEDGIPIITPQYKDARAKYQLTPKETVEAYKLLNLWREIQSEQDSMEKALGMKDDDATVARRPLNRVEPFFLYQEDSEEKRQKDRDGLVKVLQKGLESDDDVEASSNDLLMTELMEGGVTKDRAIRLLDKLMNKADRGSTIRTSLEELKKTILEDDDIIEEGEELLFRKTKTRGPVDLTGVFRTSDMEKDEEDVRVPPSSSVSSDQALADPTGRTMPTWVEEEKENNVPLEMPPPNTALFSSTSAEDEATTADVKAPPPPSTPFFQSENEEDATLGDQNPTGGMFGTYEEQRLQKLASKVGAQTDEEVEELKRNMEALKEAEEMASAQLSDDDFDIEAASAKFGIDVDSLNLDIDDDGQIMSIIGKRPVGRGGAPKSSVGQREAVIEYDESESDDIIVDATGHLKKMEKSDAQKKPDIVDDIFRAKTAGKYQDKETRDADEAAYRDFMMLEEEAERRLDSIDGEALMREDMRDIDAYADDIMSEMKPRPPVRGRREDFMSQEELQKERKKESIFGDDDPFPTSDESRPAEQTPSSGGGGDMPDWFRKEQETLGIKVEDLNDDDFEDARREWEREERQRKADEYLEKRGEGISISDVLGREYFGPMDEPDEYDKSLSSFDSFEARKELLLGFTELTEEDINNVVDYKVDPLSTGYNRYLSKVQRPFSDYGSIFRLEGVLADMIGLHAKAWKITAETTGYRINSVDEVKQASLYKAEDAVREVFRWTDDIFELKEITSIHHTAFQEAFNEWHESGCHVATFSDEVLAGGSGYSSKSNDGAAQPKATPSDEEMNSMYYLAWSKLAINLDKTAPTNDEVYEGVLGGDWEVAVKGIFGWSEDRKEVYDIVVAYDEILQADYKILLDKYGIDLEKMNAEEEESQFGFPDVASKEGVKEWLDTLQEVDMPVAVVSHLSSDQLDTVLNVVGLAGYFPHEKRVSSDSSYDNERSDLLGAALRLEQRPDQCVIFDNTPKSANEAHEVSMKSVSLVDHYARYELLTADFSVGFAGDLDLISFTKLFDERTDLEPVLELDVSSGMQKEQRKVKTAFWDE